MRLLGFEISRVKTRGSWVVWKRIGQPGVRLQDMTREQLVAELLWVKTQIMAGQKVVMGDRRKQEVASLREVGIGDPSDLKKPF